MGSRAPNRAGVPSAPAMRQRRARVRSCGLRLDAQAVEGMQHPRRRTPDDAFAEGNLPELHLIARDARAPPETMVARVEEIAERHLEGVLDLLTGERELEAGLDERHHRRDAE